MALASSLLAVPVDWRVLLPRADETDPIARRIVSAIDRYLRVFCDMQFLLAHLVLRGVDYPQTSPIRPPKSA